MSTICSRRKFFRCVCGLNYAFPGLWFPSRISGFNTLEEGVMLSCRSIFRLLTTVVLWVSHHGRDWKIRNTIIQCALWGFQKINFFPVFPGPFFQKASSCLLWFSHVGFLLPREYRVNLWCCVILHPGRLLCGDAIRWSCFPDQSILWYIICKIFSMPFVSKRNC